MNWFNALKTLTIIALICLLNAPRHFTSAEIIADENGNDKFSQELSTDDVVEAASKRALQQLHSVWGKRSSTDDEQPLQRGAPPPQFINDDGANRNLDLYGPGPRISNFNDQRTPRTMNNSWRKRDWAQLRNNWGKKREPNNWNNLRGLWGKRSSPQLTWSKPEWEI